MKLQGERKRQKEEGKGRTPGGRKSIIIPTNGVVPMSAPGSKDLQGSEEKKKRCLERTKQKEHVTETRETQPHKEGAGK